MRLSVRCCTDTIESAVEISRASHEMLDTGTGKIPLLTIQLVHGKWYGIPLDPDETERIPDIIRSLTVYGYADLSSKSIDYWWDEREGRWKREIPDEEEKNSAVHISGTGDSFE